LQFFVAVLLSTYFISIGDDIMALKVFLVEDEFVIREGIKNNIDWVGNDFEFCGEAADGELAYQKILEAQPDIIITDIKMPFMDGLELSRLVSKQLPKSKIIIISGHEEFGYAREAIKIGVTEYLLKPINAKELLKVITEVGEDIIIERQEKQYLAQYHKEVLENQGYTKIEFFNDLMKGHMSTAVILEKGKELDMELAAQFYEVILVKYKHGSKSVTRIQTSRMDADMNDLVSSYKEIVVFDQGLHGYVFLLKGDSLDQLKSLEKLFVSGLKSLLISSDIDYFGGIGNYVNRLSQLFESYHDAEKAYASSVIINRNDIIENLDIDEIVGEEKNLSFDQLELGSIDFKITEAFLRNGNPDELDQFVGEFFKSVGSASEQSLLFKQYILMNLYITVVAFMKEIGKEDIFHDNQTITVEDVRDIVSNFEKARHFMKEMLGFALSIRDNNRDNKYQKIIDSAKAYIGKHYNDEDISLNVVANFIGLSPSHFSTVFGNETGKSFIRYLTDLRIDEAKTLLKCTNLRCSDISISVGYKDPHYFSYLFKKEQGLSPMSYRSKKSN